MTITATTQTWFDSEKVYIVIGGLGGMGLEMVYWMMIRGAWKFILTSRSGIKSNSQRFLFKMIKEAGKINNSFKCLSKISKLNVVQEQNAKKRFKQAETIGQIGGIFHLAVVLHDKLIENQTLETYTEVCKSKVDATIIKINWVVILVIILIILSLFHQLLVDVDMLDSHLMVMEIQ